MVDGKAQREPSGIERFSHLEDKIYRVVEAFKTIRKENETLRSENTRLKSEMEDLRAQENAFSENMAALQKEREELRERVEKALSLLATLETK
jgi:FtsZ-binding cell division protein ZapB